METDIIKTMDKDVRTRKSAHRQIEILPWGSPTDAYCLIFSTSSIVTLSLRGS